MSKIHTQNRALPAFSFHGEHCIDPDKQPMRPGKTAEDKMPVGKRPRVARAQRARAWVARHSPTSTKSDVARDVAA